MSRTYNIACRDCNQSLWIGQGNLGGTQYIYTEQKCVDRLQSFLFSHLSHALVFDDSEGMCDYDEIPDPDDDGR
ncbi:MAG: hypothetical protein V4628_11405 [Pseudomonadota bacterium]